MKSKRLIDRNLTKMPFIEDLSGGQSQDSSHSLKKFKMRRRKIERKKNQIKDY